MKNKTRKNLLSVLFAGALLSVGFGVGGVAVSSASAEQIWTEETNGATEVVTTTIAEFDFTNDENSLFRMQGSAIRLGSSGEEAGVDYNAIRFRAVMQKDAYWAIRQKAYTSTDWEIGILVVPRTVLGDGKELTADFASANKAEVLWYNWSAAEDVTEEEGVDYVQMVYNLYNLPANDDIYKWGICARAYIRYVDDEGEKQYFYTNTIEHSMAEVATSFVKNYENAEDEVYSKPEYINQANEYRPDCEVVYRDGDKYERLRVEYGDRFVYDTTGKIESATYTNPTEYTLPYAANTATQGDFHSLLREGATTTIKENGLDVTQDVELYYLYATTRYIYQSFDIERARDSIVTFEEYPWAESAEVQSITLTNKSTSASLSYSVANDDWASVWDASTKTMTIPQSAYSSWFTAGWDAYGEDKVTVQILTTEEKVVYQTTGALCTMSIKTEQDLREWGDYSKVDYINYNSSCLKDGPTKDLKFNNVFTPNTWTDWASSGIPEIRQATKPEDRGETILNSRTYSDFLWGGYFVLANDIDCTTGEDYIYAPPIKYENLVQETNSKTTLFPSLIRYNYVAATENTKESWSNLQGSAAANGRFFGFFGTFDGRGYNIDNLWIRGGSQAGFIGTMGHTGVLKNVSFTNAKQSFPGGFICSTGDGLVENIFVHFKEGGRGGANSEKTRSGVFYAVDCMGEARVKNCFVSITDDTTTGQSNGFDYNDLTLGSFHLRYGILQNVYGVGGNYTNPVRVISTGTREADTYGAYKTYDELAAANIDFSDYTETGGNFWTLKNGFPFPKKLSTRKLHVESATSRIAEDAKISNYWGEVVNVYTEDTTRLGRLLVEVLPTGSSEWTEDTSAVSVIWNSDGTGVGLKIASGAKLDKIRIKVYSAYDINHVVLKRSFNIIQETPDYYETHGSLQFENGSVTATPNAKVDVNVSEYYDPKNVTGQKLFITTYPVDEKAYNSETNVITYPTDGFNNAAAAENGVVSTDRAIFSVKSEDGSILYALGAKPLMKVTHEINDAHELEQWLGIARYNNTKSGMPYQWGGYFVLGNDIAWDVKINDYSKHAITYNNIFKALADSDQNDAYSYSYDATNNQYTWLYNGSADPNGDGQSAEVMEYIGYFHTNTNQNAGSWCYALGQNAVGFSGTFDGNGYTISGFDTKGVFAGGFIGVLAQGGVLKNLNFKEAFFGGWSGFLTHTCAGTIQNVYLDMKYVAGGGDKNPSGILFAADKLTNDANDQNGGLASTGVIKHTFINLTNAYCGAITETGSDVAGKKAASSKFGGARVNGSTMSHVYMLSNTTGDNMDDFNVLAGILKNGGYNGFGENLWNHYANVDAWQADLNNTTDAEFLKTLNADGVYWTLDNNRFPYPVSML